MKMLLIGMLLAVCSGCACLSPKVDVGASGGEAVAKLGVKVDYLECQNLIFKLKFWD